MSHAAWLSLGVLLLLSACAVPVRIRSQDRPLPSPETSGRPFKISLGGRMGARPNIELTPDLRSMAPATSSPAVTMVEDAAVFGEIAVAPLVDVGIDFNFHEFNFRGKYQLVGNPLQTSQAGNFSLAVAGGVGASTSDYKETPTSTTTLSHQYRSFVMDASIVGGYRPADWLLTFGGVSAKYMDFEGTYTTDIAAVGSGTFRGQSVLWGPYLGVEFSRRRFRYRMAFGLTPVVTGETRKNLFSSQGELSIALGSVEN